ncbi:hypothetical protein G6F66_014371 [Rhizopus arrhizus]|nr:hypothetical protein G6F66_014371 [Rhizopus arrhizus]
MPNTCTGASIALPSAVMCGNRLNDWNTMPILRQIRRTSASLAYWLRPPSTARAMVSPSTSMLPSSMVSRWFRQRRNVLLPEPDGPITATVWPAGISRLMPRSTSSSP